MILLLCVSQKGFCVEPFRKQRTFNYIRTHEKERLMGIHCIIQSIIENTDVHGSKKEFQVELFIKL